DYYCYSADRSGNNFF
nr:immunoglobulin light chain junction region [Macaca mulatta]